MFIILPVSHEDMEAARFPYITLGIVILNTLIFIATVVSMIHSTEEYSERETALVRYYVESYTIDLYALELPEETFTKLSPESQAYILEAVRYTREMMIIPESNDRERQEALQEAQEHLDRLVETFEEVYGDNVIQKYGYVPARGGIATIFSSLFLHVSLFYIHWIPILARPICCPGLCRPAILVLTAILGSPDGPAGSGLLGAYRRFCLRSCYRNAHENQWS